MPFGRRAWKADVVSADVQPGLDRIRTAIGRARQADRRMRLAQSLADHTGMQMAIQAIQYNLVAMGAALSSLPPDLLEPGDGIPWAAIHAMADLREDPFRPVDPEALHRTVQVDLAALEGVLDRLRVGG